MTSERAKQRRHEAHERKRREASKELQAQETQRQQAEAAARREFEQRRRRHVKAYVLFAMAALLAVSHFFQHAGLIEPLPPAMADLLIGWPMAALLALVGGIVYGV